MTTETRTERLREVTPAADIATTPEGVRLSIEMPGAKKETIAVTVEDEILDVRAERADFLAGSRLLHRETERGAYRRAFRLSRDLAREGIEADYRLGVLSVFVPRAEHTIPRRIEIRSED